MSNIDKDLLDQMFAEQGNSTTQSQGAFDDLIPSDIESAGARPGKPANEEPSLALNASKLAINRTADLAGSMVSGVGKVITKGSELLADGINNVAGTNIKPAPIGGFLSDVVAPGISDFDAGYQEHYSMEKLVEDPNVENVMGMIAEKGVASIPDMYLAFKHLPAYIGTRTEEIALERAQQDGREKPGANDYLISFQTAVATSLMERIAPQSAFAKKPVTDSIGAGVKQFGKEVVKTAGKEAGTEFVQENLEYVATNAGTKTGWNAEEALMRGGEGAIVGGGVGGGTSVVGQAYNHFADKDSAQTNNSPNPDQSSPISEDENPIAPAGVGAGFEAEQLSQDELNANYQESLQTESAADAQMESVDLINQDVAVDHNELDPQIMKFDEPSNLEVTEQPLQEQSIDLEQEPFVSSVPEVESDPIINEEPAQETLAQEEIQEPTIEDQPAQTLESIMEEAYGINSGATELATEQFVTQKISTEEFQQALQGIAQSSPNSNEIAFDEQTAGVKRALKQKNTQVRTKRNTEAVLNTAEKLNAKIKNRTKKVIKKIKQSEQSKAFDKGLEKRFEQQQLKAEQANQEVLRQEYEQTQLAREFRLAEEHNLDREFSAVHKAVQKSLKPGNNIDVDAFMTNYIEDEVKAVEIENQVHEAATSPNNDRKEPTQAQKEAGNYKKSHIKHSGFDIAIENPKGSIRQGTDKNGKAWSVEMKSHYGDIKRTNGADNDPIDVFVNPETSDSDKVYIVNQVEPSTGKFDEHKVMLGYNNIINAKRSYHENYDSEWKNADHEFIKVSKDELNDWIKNGDTTKPYQKVNNITEKENTLPDNSTSIDELNQLGTLINEKLNSQNGKLKGIRAEYAKAGLKADKIAKASGYADGINEFERSLKAKWKENKSKPRSENNQETKNEGFDGWVEWKKKMKAKISKITFDNVAHDDLMDQLKPSVLADMIRSEGAESFTESAEIRKRYQQKLEHDIDNWVRAQEEVDTKEGSSKETDPDDDPTPPKPPKKKLDKAADKVDAELQGALEELADAFKEANARANSGLDPKLVMLGTKVSALYLAKGSIKFAQWASAVLSGLKSVGIEGDTAKPYLKKWYLQSMDDVSDSVLEQMDDVKTVRSIDVDSLPAKETKQKNINNPSNELIDTLYLDHVSKGNVPKNLTQFKAILAEHYNIKASEVTHKQVKEAQDAFEAAVVKQARDHAQSGDTVENITEKLISLYESQLNLNGQDAISHRQQAFSTPSPISYLANVVAGIGPKTKVLEPTAGNGLLLLTNKFSNTRVNEISPDRIKQLEWLGYTNISDFDAMSDRLIAKAKSKDSVIMNPPFGKADKSKIFKGADGYDYELKDLDHIIAIKQLEAMKDDGRAVLILGADKEPGITKKGKAGIFLNYLYSNYNVVDHIELAGRVYRKQGAEWPIRIITIAGRENTGNYAPANGTVERIEGSNERDIINGLLDHYRSNGLLETQEHYGRSNSNTKLSDESLSKDNTTSDPQSKQKQNLSRNNQDESSRSKSNNGDGRVNGVDKLPNGSLGNSGTSNISSNNTDQPTGSKGGEFELATNGKISGTGQLRNADDVIADLKTTKNKNEFQSEYKTASDGFNEKVLTPVNMASKTQKALSNLVEKVGSLETFIGKALSYPSVEAVHKAFMGLQIDGVAMAIDKISQGKAVIVADQTGVGKGRQAAAVLRFAAETGKIPVFITEKPNLFSDMHGDLLDIGYDKINPFIMNDGQAVVTVDNAGTELEQVNRLFANDKGERKDGLNSLSQGNMPEGKNAVFLTYSQINKVNNQQKALQGIAENAIFVFDESHNGAGQDSNVGIFSREILSKAQGAMFLSATYAKRPDNLGLYHSTSLGEAVSSMSELQDALNEGGLQLQTLVSSMLSEEGELFRRERSFEGIEIKNVIDKENSKEHRAKFDKSTAILREIVSLGKGFEYFIKEQNKKGGNELVANSNLDKLNPFSFASVVHNYVSQLTMAIKAETTATKAIEALKRNEKPVIAVDSTLESKLNEYAETYSLSTGDNVSDFDFSFMFEKGLENAFSLSQKLPNGQTEKIPFNRGELPAYLQQKITDIRKMIATENFSDIPVSPIDLIRHRIKEAGFSVAEITGRSRMIDYGNNMEITNKPADETHTKRKDVVDRFNSGKLDVLILNQAGSTGLSIHASEKFNDQRKRHMVVAQPSLNINTFMQMLGRINRTGQVETHGKPSYDILWLDLPSENRPATVLANKLKKLNANTSANTDSATSVESLDMFNQYGNEIVEQFLMDNSDYIKALGINASKVAVEKASGDLAQFITGKLALLSTEKQQEFYDEVTPMYNDYVTHLKAVGQYQLEAQDMELDAKPESQEILDHGKNKTVFDSDIKLTHADVKAQGKPPSPDEMMEVYKNANSEAVKEIAQSAEDEFYSSFKKDNLDNKIKEISEKVNKETDTDKITSLTDKQAELSEKWNGTVSKSMEVLSSLKRLREGQPIKLMLSEDETINGIVKGVNYKHNGKGNPLSPSKFKVEILTASGYGTLYIPMSKLLKTEYSTGHVTVQHLKNVFEAVYNRPMREKRYIVTGNLIKAFSMVQGGKVISFTKQGGGTEIGLVMPKGFKKGDVTKKQYAENFSMVKKLLDSNDVGIASLGIVNIDGLQIARFKGEYRVGLPANKSDMRRKYLEDTNVHSILGNVPAYNKGDKKVYQEVTASQAERLFDYYRVHSPFPMSGSTLNEFNQANGLKTEAVVNTENIYFSKTKSVNSLNNDVISPARATLEVRKFLKEFTGLGDVRIKIGRTEEEVFGRKVSDEGWSTYGAFDPERNEMSIVAGSFKNVRDLKKTIMHELLVHKGLGLYSETAQKDLLEGILSAVKNGEITTKLAWNTIKRDYADEHEIIQAEELLALLSEQSTSFWNHPKLNALIRAFRRLLRKLNIIKNDLGKAELIHEVHKIAEQVKLGRKPKNNRINPDTSASDTKFKKQIDDTSNSSWLKSIKNKVNYLPKGLALVTNNQIVEMFSKTADGFGSSLRKYNRLLGQLEGYRQETLQKAEKEVEEKWDKLTKKDSDTLGELFHDATMSRLHPDRKFEDQPMVRDLNDKIDAIEETIDRTYNMSEKQENALDSMKGQLYTMQKNHAILEEKFNGMKPDAQELYRDVEQFYLDTWVETKTAIVERINDMQADDRVKRATIDQISNEFEKAIKDGPYFPLKRFGDHVVTAKKLDKNGEVSEYIREHFESKQLASDRQAELKAEGYKSRYTLAKPFTSEDMNNLPSFAKDLAFNLKKLEDETLFDSESSLSTEQVLDDVWQLMLRSLPNQSAAKSLIHRKRTKGASSDGRRGFADSIFHQSFRVARIKFAHKMQSELDEMGRIVDESEVLSDREITKSSAVYNEMLKRHELTMNPQGSPVASLLGAIGFTWYLSGSVGAGIVNMTQTWLVALPMLGARHGYINAANQLSKISAEYASSPLKWEKSFGQAEAWKSMSRSDKLTSGELSMLEALYKDGTIDVTQAHALSQVADTDMKNSPVASRLKTRGLRALGSFFHNAEVYNREVTAMAAFRMFKKDNPNATDSQAISYARNSVTASQFNYSSSNRARVMRYNNVKVITQFKQYSQNMLYTLLRGVYQSVGAGDTNIKEASIARKQLTGILGLHFALAGAVGMPLMEIVFSLADSFREDEDDEFLDSKTEFKHYMHKEYGDLGDAITRGVVNEATGINLASRVALNNMLWRTPQREMTLGETIQHYAKEAGGPMVGLAGNLIYGASLASEGKYYRATEKFVPKFLSDPLKAIRYGSEGNKNLSGNEVMGADDFTALQLGAQTLGFSSDSLSRRYEEKGAETKLLVRINKRRRELLRNAYDAVSSGEAIDNKLIDSMAHFNKMHPNHAITKKSLQASIKARLRNNEHTVNGVRLSPKQEYIRDKFNLID